MFDPKENCITCVIHSPTGIGSLYIGNIYSIEADIIEKYNIKAAVSAIKADPSLTFIDIDIFLVPLDDIHTQNIQSYFDQSIQFITQQLESANVLVYCLAGLSRSASIIIAYLMKTQKLSFEDSLQLLQQKRKIHPNAGFISQLKIYETSLKSK